MSTPLATRLQAFRDEREAIRKELVSMFKYRDAVRVNCDRYKGTGIYICIWHEDPTKVLVRLANGNEWAYPAETVQPIDPKSLKPSARLDHLRFCGVPCSGVSHVRTLRGRLP